MNTLHCCLTYYLLAINAVAFIMYGIDKYKAKKAKWRIPEATLLLLAVLGGSIGAWMGMKVWHHKTKHKKFKYGIPAIQLIQMALMRICTSNFENNLLNRNRAMNIDTTNLCSHLQKKLFEPEGEYHAVWQAIQHDDELTAVVRQRQLHIYRCPAAHKDGACLSKKGKKILILAGKAQPKIIREDKLNELIKKQHI